jgi:hypothetical protein
MKIKIDENRFYKEKEPIVHDEEQSNIWIPLKFENWKGKPIKQYRIDKISAIEKKEEKTGQKEKKKNPIQKIWEMLKQLRQGAGEKNKGKIMEFYTPEKSEEKPTDPNELDDEEKKTTKIVKSKGLWCQAIVTDKNEIKKLEQHKKYKMALTLFPEEGGEIKRQIIFEVDRDMKKKEQENKPAPPLRRSPDYLLLYANLFIFIITLLGYLYWNNYLNYETYARPAYLKGSFINLGIGVMVGYFGISILKLIFTLLRAPFKFNFSHFFKFPELHFETDFVKKLRSKVSLVILVTAFVLLIPLFLYFRSVPLPPLPSEYFSYYDYNEAREIKPARIYLRDIANVRIGPNKKHFQDKKNIYFAGLKLNGKNEPVPFYKEFTIQDNLMSDRTRFNFAELAAEKELEGNKKYVFDYVCGRKIIGDNIKLVFNGDTGVDAGIIKVIHADCLNLGELTRKLKAFHKKISTKNFDIKTFITGKDWILCSYKDEFLKSIGTKTVCANELLGIYEFYTREMNTGFENDIKRMALIWCQFHTALEFNTRFTNRKMQRILEIFESYYKRSNIEGISDIDQRITQVYLRLLLYIEKNFAEGAYEKIHESIARVLDSKGSGGEYYLYYLEECIRNKVLFEPDLETTEESIRERFFKDKLAILKKLRKSVTILKRITGMAGIDERSKTFLEDLIEELTSEPDIPANKEEEPPGNSAENNITFASGGQEGSFEMLARTVTELSDFCG